MTPIIVALILASPVPIVDTTSAADESIQETEWSVFLPDPKDLLKDWDRGSMLFDGLGVDRRLAVTSSESSDRARAQSQPDEQE